mmetsp:Transcript_69877/g.186117  ORF Transcript_69877/g.186117 Transcript_69877/m.186117 type:complete len:159 (+) Transcript_69877:391-867(+)
MGKYAMIRASPNIPAFTERDLCCAVSKDDQLLITAQQPLLESVEPQKHVIRPPPKPLKRLTFKRHVRPTVDPNEQLDIAAEALERHAAANLKAAAAIHSASQSLKEATEDLTTERKYIKDRNNIEKDRLIKILGKYQEEVGQHIDAVRQLQANRTGPA